LLSFLFAYRRNKTNKKKLFVLLPAALLALSGCNPSESPSSEDHSQASQVASSEKSVSSEEPVKTYSVSITQVEHATVSADKMEAEVGQTITFTITVDEDYHVSSFKVNGVDVAITDNKATAQMVENGLTVTIAVEVNTHDVTIHPSENGTVTADKETAIVGDKVTFTITPNDDFELDTFKINNEAKEVTNNTFEATMVKEGLTVDATFKAIKHAVTINQNEGGTVTADKMEAATGEEVTLTVTPNENYQLSALYVNGQAVSVGENGTVTVPMVKEGLIVSGVFAKKSASITITNTKGGTIYASPSTEASIGDDVEIEVQPDAGYELDKLLVNGEEVAVSNGFADVKMVEGGLTITAVWKELAKTITIVSSENGTVTANKEKAEVGETVIFTISPAEGYHLESFKVNGTEVEVDGDSYSATMTEAGLSIEAIFSDTYKVASISESLKATIKESNTAKVTLTADSNIDAIPLAKKETVIDLGGKTLTVTSATALLADDTHIQDITIKNGKINVVNDEQNKHIFNVNNAHSLILDRVTLTNTTSTFAGAGIYCSAITNLEIKNSTLDLKAVYGIGTNNTKGKNAKIILENSHITVTTDEKDNTAFFGTIEGIDVTFKNSSLKADRQALIARIGTWKADASTFEITGAWLNGTDKATNNKTTNDSYLSGSWKSGNEVPSAAVVIGDNLEKSYNQEANFTFTNSCKIISPEGSKIVSRTDGIHDTTINFDALTYVNAYDSMDHGEGVNVVTQNVLTKTIAEMNELTENDDKNLYCVTGILKEITKAKYGNGYLEDQDTGETLMLYGSYTEATILKSDSGIFSLKETTEDYPSVIGTALSEDNVGRMVTVFGTFKNYKDTKEIVDSFALPKGEKISGLTATIEVNDSAMGSATLSKTEGITFGETITVDVIANSGYELSKIEYTDKVGKVTDITTGKKFNADLANSVKVTFAEKSSTPTKKTATFVPTDFQNASNIKIVQTISGFTFQIDTGTIDDTRIGVFKSQKLTITAEEGTKILKIEITCTAEGEAKYGPGCFSDTDTTNHYKHSGKTGVWENADGQQKVSLKADKNQVRITKMVVTYLA